MSRTFLALIGVLCLAASGEARGVTIAVNEESLVRGPSITIGEVAAVQGDDRQIVAQVQAIVIGQSPPAGEERFLSGDYIVTRLKQHGFALDKWTLKIPPKLRIVRAFQRLEARDMEAAVQREIKRQMPWEPKAITIREIRGIESVVLPPGDVQYDILFPGRTDFLGPTSFSLLLRIDGNVEKRLYGTAYIETVLDVVFVVRPIAKHDVIVRGDVKLQQATFSRSPPSIFTRVEDVIGKRARRSLRTNQMLRTREIESQPLVQKGSTVFIVAESAQLKISVMGEALEPGDKGETIRVRNTTSRREVRAVVVDNKTVKVPF